LAIFVIVSLLLEARWVFQVFLALQDRRIALDTNYDGREDYFEYWEKGELIFTEWDTNFDGVIDYRNRFKQGVVFFIENDADHDGYFEYREFWKADGENVVEIDEDGDGVFTRKILKPVDLKNGD